MDIKELVRSVFSIPNLVSEEMTERFVFHLLEWMYGVTDGRAVGNALTELYNEGLIDSKKKRINHKMELVYFRRPVRCKPVA